MIIRTNPILPTKLYIPPLREAFVSRKNLLKQLDRGLNRKLTLVSAPAGYGKSTLLSEWVRQISVPAAWLSLDHGDNDPTRFWSYFLAALDAIPGMTDIWESTATSDSRQNIPFSDTETTLADLIIAIAAAPKRFVFVLDDLQAITDSSLLDSLFFLVENLPPGPKGMHLVIASRNDPPWPLARLRVQNQVTEVRAQDLNFSIEECAIFINDVMGLALTLGEIAELDQRTEGWIAGLQMAAISMQGREDISSFLQAFSGSHRFVLDFLVEEVLSRQSPEILDFLLKTSILETMNGALCQAVTGDSDSSAILLKLEKANLFLVALDDQRIWYRYHHLFGDLLQKQLGNSLPAQVPELHCRASHWYAQNKMPRASVNHALKSDDWIFASEQVQVFILDQIQHGEMTLARQWLGALPDEVVHKSPVLCLAQAWTSAKYATVSLAEEILAQTEAALANEPAEDGSITPHVYELVNRQIALLHITIARIRGESPHRQQELALKTLQSIISPDDISSRAMLLFRIGLCYLDLGKDEQADQTFSQAVELGQASGNFYAAHIAIYGRMVIARRRGQLHDLEKLCRKAFEIKTGQEEQLSLQGIASIMAGDLCYEWNKLEQAAQFFEEGLANIERVELVELLIKGQFRFACLKAVQGNASQIPNLIKMAENSNPGLKHFAAALQIRLYLILPQWSQGKEFNVKINEWAEAHELALRAEPNYDWEIYEILVYARVRCRQFENQPGKTLESRLEEVFTFIEKQGKILENLKWWGLLVEANILQALILHTLERKTEALDYVKQALSLAENQGYLRIFLDEGPPLKKLIQKALVAGIREDYARKILAAFERSPQATPQDTSPRLFGLIDPLSTRELQVLRLLNTQLSVPEIAAEISLAPTTVRTHVQHIYQKLGVHGRIEALRKAEELGLL